MEDNRCGWTLLMVSLPAWRLAHTSCCGRALQQGTQGSSAFSHASLSSGKSSELDNNNNNKTK